MVGILFNLSFFLLKYGILQGFFQETKCFDETLKRPIVNPDPVNVFTDIHHFPQQKNTNTELKHIFKKF